MNKFQYSQDTINKLKELYPTYEAAHLLAKSGSKWLIQYLEGSYGVIPLDTILTAVSLDELQHLARIEKRKALLYQQVVKEYNAIQKS